MPINRPQLVPGMIYALALRGVTLKYGAMPVMFLGYDNKSNATYYTLESHRDIKDFHTYEDQFKAWLDPKDDEGLEHPFEGESDDWNGPYKLLAEPDEGVASWAPEAAFVKLWSDYFDWEKSRAERKQKAEEKKKRDQERQNEALLQEEAERERKYNESPNRKLDDHVAKEFGSYASGVVYRRRRTDSEGKDRVRTSFTFNVSGKEHARKAMKALGIPEDLIENALSVEPE